MTAAGKATAVLRFPRAKKPRAGRRGPLLASPRMKRAAMTTTPESVPAR